MWRLCIVQPVAALRRQRVQQNIDAEFGVVFGQEAFVAEVVVPLAAVVFVGVKHAEAAVDFDAFQVVVYQVVAPAVQLEGSGRRAIGELEELRVDDVGLGDFL